VIPATARMAGLVGLEGVQESDPQRIDEGGAAGRTKLIRAGMDETDDPPELLALAGDTGGSFPASPAVQSNEGALEQPVDADADHILGAILAVPAHGRRARGRSRGVRPQRLDFPRHTDDTYDAGRSEVAGVRAGIPRDPIMMSLPQQLRHRFVSEEDHVHRARS